MGVRNDREVVTVRIGFDMLAVQSPHHGNRGIGRYANHLVSALLARDDGHQYIFYAHDGLPDHRIPTDPRAELRRLQPDPNLGVATVIQCVDRLARLNPDALDVLVVTSPFEHWADYLPPAHPRNGLRLVSVVYDMIPFLFPSEGGHDSLLLRYYRILEELKRYDALLAISESTVRDCTRMLGLPEGRVVNISGASDDRLFVPDLAEPMSDSSRRLLRGLGINRPFVFNVGGLDERKNSWRLLDAFAALPERIRREYQFVLTFYITTGCRAEVVDYARRIGIVDQLILTGEVSDEALRVLYQRCTAFIMPSLYEGFGLPLLEAMHCGAVVIAGKNSSQVEVVGDAGLLVNACDTADIAAKILKVVEHPEEAARLKEKAVNQARQFSWERTAERTIAVLDRLTSREPAALPRRRLRVDRRQGFKPRIAFFSPLPPRRSGISDYSAFLLDELRQVYRIDLFHDLGYVPDLALASDEFQCLDARLFGRYAASRDYHAIVYQMGNSRYHNFMYEILLDHPGVVTLHDFALAGFHLHHGRRRGEEKAYIRRELLRWYPEQAEIIEARFAEWPWDWELITRECIERGWLLNKRLLSRSRCVIVHSPWCMKQVNTLSPEYAGRVTVIPHGIWPRRLPADERAAIRDRFDIPRDALMIASFGFIHPDKMSPEALDVFEEIARREQSALFVFVGEEMDGGLVRRHAETLGLEARVRFLGRAQGSDFWDLGAVTDLGINLRRPPTHGETSGALLNLLASGVATVVTDVGTFSDYPDNAVRKVRWESDGIAGLRQAMIELATDQAARELLGRSAYAYVCEHHEWSKVARQYVEEIERSRAGGDAGGTIARSHPLIASRLGTYHTPDRRR
jgi:glycosyltransferase involved in cell wall biosynthesis